MDIESEMEGKQKSTVEGLDAEEKKENAEPLSDVKTNSTKDCNGEKEDNTMEQAEETGLVNGEINHKSKEKSLPVTNDSLLEDSEPVKEKSVPEGEIKKDIEDHNEISSDVNENESVHGSEEEQNCDSTETKDNLIKDGDKDSGNSEDSLQSKNSKTISDGNIIESSDSETDKKNPTPKENGISEADDCVEVIDDDEVTNNKEKKSSDVDENILKKSRKALNSSIKIAKDDSLNNDDIEIVGESKPVILNGTPSKPTSHNVLILSQTPNSGGSIPVVSKSFPSTLLARNLQQSGHRLPTILGGSVSLSSNFVINNSSPNSLTAPQTAAPPKPKSSLDQIELIRWEIANRVNTRPKYFKPNPTSELGPLSKFLFDMGSDLIKESVYHELVKIQSKKNDEKKLSDKEQNDLEKLKEIEKDLHATIGHLKMKMKKKCKTCQFQTESTNVMFFHKQFPHEEEKVLKCSHCKFTSKQASAYKFHAEAEHNIQAKLHERKAFYECNMCPYENNQEQKIVIHKQRCLKQFRPHFNLHPSCLSGAEINLCLENIFYKPIVPKGLKILQQKHAQQQAALAEARRQQAQVQALAAQKNKPAVKGPQIVRMPQAIAPRQPQQKLASMPRLPIQVRSPLQNKVRLPEKGKSAKPTVANMLNNRQNIPVKGGPPPPTPSGKAHGGFEVCEICGGYVKDRKALRIHFFYAHRIDLPFNLFERQLAPLYCATCYVRFWTAQGLRKHIDTHKEENATTGVVGKCISCGHHVLNLLIHMRIVHNREIQHYINALMCMFCGMHFGSRSDVDAHIKKTHGLIDPVTGSIKSSTSVKSAQQQPKNSKKSSSPQVKGSVCVLCNLNFGRNVDLTRHCMRMHHTCMKCGMVVIDKASLIKHACLSSPSGTRDCTMCKETGFHPAYFVKHLRDKHLKKFVIEVTRLSKETIEKWTKRPYNQEEKVCVEISDSSEDESVDKKIEPKQQSQPPKKRPRMGPASVMKKFEAQKVSEIVQVEDDEDESSVEKNNVKDEDSDTKIDTCEKSVTNDEKPDNENERCGDESSVAKPGQKRKIGPLSFQAKRQKSS